MKTKFFSVANRLVAVSGIITILILSGCKKELQQTSVQSEEAVVNSSSVAQEQQTGGKYVPNEMIVKFKTGVSEDAKTKIFSKHSASVSERILTKMMKKSGDNEGVYLLHTSLAVFDAISKMKGNTEIEYAEPNYIYQHEVTSNDPYFTNNSLWGMNGTYGCNASTAWGNGHTGSSNVYVGVIDEGAMYNHEDLAGNFGNPNEIAGNGIDDDGNGYIDDANGWDFVSNDNTTFDGIADDHGTHVSGTIGGIGGNGKGVAGVNWAVKIISAKFLGTNGGTTANAIKAVDYITDLKTRDGLNIVATNNSWGGGGFSQGLQDAIERANAANILFVAAAGNDGANIDATASYPAGYPNANIISVAAITSTGGLASFSNYGVTRVDIGAPGSGVYSTVPARKGKNVASSYASYSGTSMATPHVTGACALYAATHGGNAAAIKAAILNSATATPSLSGKCVTGGRLNVSGF
ncbi:MAG TPA: S8 family peptidase [Chitinophagaceae bacterium]|nr:S8 family peptidase [Chitinophagaceae bacterium]